MPCTTLIPFRKSTERGYASFKKCIISFSLILFWFLSKRKDVGVEGCYQKHASSRRDGNMHINMAVLGTRIILMIFTLTRSHLLDDASLTTANALISPSFPPWDRMKHQSLRQVHCQPLPEGGWRCIGPPALGLVRDCLWPVNLGEWADAARALGALEGFRLAFALLT